MRILLIHPNTDHNFSSTKYRVPYRITKKVVNKLCKIPMVSPTGGYILPPLSIVVVAANIPSGIDIEICDERIEEIDFNKPVDLVGITVLTATANHSYHIAQKFRQKGVPVILGGIHPTLLPDEAAKFANSIVIGEVEGLWEEIITDLKKQQLKPFYKNEKFPSLKNLPTPRFDLLTDSYITTNIIETSRGCPHRCSFCATSKSFGNKYRFRPVTDIINEIKNRNLQNQFVVFMSDNIFGNLKFAESLFKGLIPMNIKWLGSSTLSIANYPNILKLASQSGCKSLLIGFESLTVASLSGINKHQNSNPENYPELIKKIHDANIGITGNFIVGLDDDQPSAFPEIVKFVRKNNIECPQVSILIPYPGTQIFESLKKEGRIVNFNWDHYANNVGNVIFKPKNMSINELAYEYRKTWKKIYSTWSILKRLIATRNFLVFYFPYNIIKKMKPHLKNSHDRTLNS